jgi:hypothetical protein
VARKPIEFTCRSCYRKFDSAEYGAPLPCSHCGETLSRIVQLEQLLEQWFYPRRWRADLHEPNPYYLLEKLWTANGQGEMLYNGIQPQHANFDVFRHLVTRLVARGVDEGWIDLEFPDDPLDENPVYQLKFDDPDRFARGVEQLFPEVDWDEQIEVPAPAEAAASLGDAEAVEASAVPDKSEVEKPKRPTPIGAARSARRGRRRR